MAWHLTVNRKGIQNTAHTYRSNMVTWIPLHVRTKQMLRINWLFHRMRWKYTESTPKTWNRRTTCLAQKITPSAAPAHFCYSYYCRKFSPVRKSSPCPWIIWKWKPNKAEYVLYVYVHTVLFLYRRASICSPLFGRIRVLCAYVLVLEHFKTK